MCPFDYKAFVVNGKVVYSTSRVAIVTQTDHPKSLLNRCFNEDFSGILCCQVAFWIFSVGVGVLVIGRSQISFFFSLCL